MGRASFAAAHPTHRTLLIFSPSTHLPDPTETRAKAQNSRSENNTKRLLPAMEATSSSKRTDPNHQPEGDPDAPDVVALHSRARAAAVQREALAAGAPPAPSTRREPLVSALRGLVRELEDLTDEQDAVILRLRRKAGETGEAAETARRRFVSLKAALRQAVQKNVDVARNNDAKDEEIRMLKQNLAEAEENVAKANAEAKERESAVANKVAEFENRIARDAEQKAAADEEWARQADRAATLEQQLRAVRREADLAKEETKAQAVKIADAEYELLYLSETAKRADQLAVKQRQLVAARAKDAEAAAKQVAAASAAAKVSNERIAALETRLASAEAESAAASAGAEEALRRADEAEATLIVANADCDALREEVMNLQSTCTDYASAIAMASHQQLAAVDDCVHEIDVSETDNDFEGDIPPHDDQDAEEENTTDEGPSQFARNPLAETLISSGPLSNVPQVKSNPEDDASKPRKFAFRVDVPDFQPGKLFVANEIVGGFPVENRRAKHCPESSFSNLYWCPPGTTTKTVVKTVHKTDFERAQVVELTGDRWADGFALWYDLATALIPGAGCATSPPHEGSDEYWQEIETAFLSVGDDEEDVSAPAPIVFVVRKAGALAQASENVEFMGGCAFEACVKITKLLDLLHGIHSSLVADRFSVSIVLEGWPSSIPLGSHFAQSLALPRVSRRSGKAKRYNRRMQERVL